MHVKGESGREKWNNEDDRWTTKTNAHKIKKNYNFCHKSVLWAWIGIKIIIICLNLTIRNDRHFWCQWCANESYTFFSFWFLYLNFYLYVFIIVSLICCYIYFLVVALLKYDSYTLVETVWVLSFPRIYAFGIFVKFLGRSWRCWYIRSRDLWFGDDICLLS